jgi:hypothetical protein
MKKGTQGIPIPVGCLSAVGLNVVGINSIL